jgi:hypothetical protein
MKLRVLLAELRRRGVYRMAAAYAVTAWLVIEVASTTFPHLSLPGWTVTATIALAVLGFPLALVLSWIFVVTREGGEESLSGPAFPHQWPPRSARAGRRHPPGRKRARERGGLRNEWLEVRQVASHHHQILQPSGHQRGSPACAC